MTKQQEELGPSLPEPVPVQAGAVQEIETSFSYGQKWELLPDTGRELYAK